MWPSEFMEQSAVFNTSASVFVVSVSNKFATETAGKSFDDGKARGKD